MSLKDKALSCTFTSRAWQGKRLDRKLRTEIATTHDTDIEIAKVTRNLFVGCDQPLKNVVNAIERVRETHEYYSVPWPPHRAVKIENYPIHRDKTKDAINAFQLVLKEFYDQYPTLVQRGILNSKGLATEDEYIQQEEIWDRFAVSITYGQLDDANDWLKATLLSPEEVQELMDQTKNSQQELTNNVLEHIKVTIAKHLLDAREALTKKSIVVQPGMPKPRFHTAWLANFQSLASLLPGFNLPDDPNVAAILVDLEPTLKHTTDTMKTSEVAQAEALQNILAVIEKYRGWLNS